MGKDSFTFSSESVGEGHPDKVADAISDAILDACLAGDPGSRVACETLVKSNLVFLAGEITTEACLDYHCLVRDTLRGIGYDHEDDIFHADKVFLTNAITRQSRDIGQGVDARAAEGKEGARQGAGDQGIMFGYATRATEEFMPLPVMLAHRLLRRLAEMRRSGEGWTRELRPDCKAQVAVHYEGGRPIGLENVVVSTQHTEAIGEADLRHHLEEELLRAVLPEDLLLPETRFLANPTGRFVAGGPYADAGLTGRKIIVDTYGGWSRHGGGAFSGKDATKVDRSAAYMARWIALNLVAAGLADEAEVQLAYAIGYPEPTSVLVQTFGTGRVPELELSRAVRESFDLTPAGIIEALDLRDPIFRSTTHYGHFGKAGLPWERPNRVDALTNAL